MVSYTVSFAEEIPLECIIPSRKTRQFDLLVNRTKCDPNRSVISIERFRYINIYYVSVLIMRTYTRY